jgi:flagellar protein FlbT
MSKTMQISLRAGERVYINGAVVKVDRKVTLELLNNVVFLLESHVLQADQTTTPLRQLYFVLQTILMDPKNAKATLALFRHVLEATQAAFTSEIVVSELRTVATLVEENRAFDALRLIRALFDTEAEILSPSRQNPQHAA